MTNTEPVASIHRAVHRLRGLDAEMNATLPLADGETVLVAGTAWGAHRFFRPSRLYLRVSSDRLCVAEDYMFRPDQITEARRQHIVSIGDGPEGRVVIVVRTPLGDRQFELAPAARHEPGISRLLPVYGEH